MGETSVSVNSALTPDALENNNNYFFNYSFSLPGGILSLGLS